MDEHGLWTDDQDIILKMFFTEFINRFKNDYMSDISSMIPLSRDITDLDNERLIVEATDEEIYQAVTQTNPLKAPGPDGMHAIFYQKYWHIV